MSNQSKPLSLIYNHNAGFRIEGPEGVYEQLTAIFSAHGYQTEAYEIQDSQQFEKIMLEVRQRHLASEEPGIVVAAGGDGTLNTVAKHLLNTPISVGILPLGTFNYVARLLDIPLDLLEAAEVIVTGQTKRINVAQINQDIYLNNASLGLYPLFIKKREDYNRIFGRFPLHAYTSALDVLIRDRKELRLEIWVDQKKYPVKTPLIFFGNNPLQLADMNMQIAEAAEQGKVAGVVVSKSDKLTLFKLVYQLIRGKIDQASDISSFAADQIRIESKRKKLIVAIDGEIVEMSPPLNIAVLKNSLSVRVPHASTSV
ncbi:MULTISPECIES: diacylglycerol kinase family protein [unclassified Acinetobacter]|uniref:diacylglycerol/lipid kinase family protein n=1 Tax=unclassified Acinetobacter TaxID=196816 RepID=UPI001C21253A|nr:MULTISPECIES: diacylglycerol kinase family protein [unclassified Acinetobacter]